MALRAVLDSNVALYHVNDSLAEPLPVGEYFVSVITRIEMLSFPKLTTAEENAIHKFLGDNTVIGLNEIVEVQTIELRKRTKLRMVDAIIAATAIVLDATLLTHDATLLKVTGLKAPAPKLR